MGPTSSDAEPTQRGYSPGARVFNRYVLGGVLGHGGMGVVWRARDETLGEEVALKFLPDAVRWDPGAYDDLKDETRRARQLTHPNIVRIHDFVEDAGSAAISMELVEGATLAARRLERPGKVFEPAEIAPWLEQLGAALDYAHREARVVHRDLKPANLMLTREGRLKVADFGVARGLADSITRVSMMTAGTMVYMSPQQALGEPPMPADDVYALGATLYELLTGKPPFYTGDVRMQLMQRRPESVAARRKALGVAAGAVPASWEETLAACLAKEPQDRPASVGEMVRRLQDTTRAATGRRALRRTRREWTLAAVAIVLGVAAWGLRPGMSGTAAAEKEETRFASDETRALAAWNFDGDGRDWSGRGLDAFGALLVPTTDRFGRIDRALAFNGQIALAVKERPELQWNGRQPFTAAIWVRQDESPVLNGTVWSLEGGGVGSLVWGLGFDRGCANVMFSCAQHDDGLSLTADQALAMGEWHHLAMVSDGEQLQLFANGKRVAARPLGKLKRATESATQVMRFARPFRFSSWALTGALDDARLWRRALSAEEIGVLARRERPQRIVVSSGSYAENDDLSGAIKIEFGEGARLADWADFKRLRSDDVRSWFVEANVSPFETIGWVQRDGERRFDEKRYYFVQSFDGEHPAYFKAHDELGGFALALGSWYSMRARAMVVVPDLPQRRETLAATGQPPQVTDRGRFEPGRTAFSLTWRGRVTPVEGMVTNVRLQLGDGQEWNGVCLMTRDAIAVALGPRGGGGVSRNLGSRFGDVEFSLVARDGRLAFRAVSVVGQNPLFGENIEAPGFRLAAVSAIEITGGPESGLAAATLVVE